MRRLVRITAYILILLTILIGSAATLLSIYQDKVIAFVMDSIHARIHLGFTVGKAQVHLERHLGVVLTDVHISQNGKEISTIKSIHASVGYHSIFSSNGLPLYSVTVDTPLMIVPRNHPGTPEIALPRPEAAAIERMAKALRALSQIARRIEIINATLAYRDGSVLFDRVGLLAYRRRHGLNWYFAFDATIQLPPYAGAHFAGRISAQSDQPTDSHDVGKAQLWVWGIPITNLHAEGFDIDGEMQGSVAASIHDDGSLSGTSTLGIGNLALAGPRLATPIQLGDYSVNGSFDFNETNYSITQLTVQRVGQHVLTGETQVSQPYSGNPRLGISLQGFELELGRLKKQVLEVRNLPRATLEWVRRIASGSVRVGQASFSAPVETIRAAPLLALRENLTIFGTLQGVAFAFPPELKLPDISALTVQINYAKGVVTFAQGSAKLGRTQVKGVAGRIDLRKGFQDAPYTLQASADTDLGELFPAISLALRNNHVPNYDRLKQLSGVLDFESRVQGRFDLNAPTPPASYVLTVAANGAVFTLDGAPGPVTVRRGAIVFSPGDAKIQKIVAAATGGDANLNGEVQYGAKGFLIKTLSLDFHHMPSESWLGLVVDPSDLAVKGPIGGSLTISGNPKIKETYSGNGKLTLAGGQVQFNFLRAPMIVSAATIELTRRRLVVSMPASKLEGSPIDFRITVPDIVAPTVRMDANLQHLDFEVMRFIRMPWSPATPPVKFPIPASGHIKAATANLGKFPMQDLDGDFTRSPSGDWRVYNFAATAFRGKLNLDLRGRGPDNWVHLVGKVANMDPAPLFMMTGKRKDSPILGQLSMGEDLWANMDTNFYDTLAGQISVTIRDGTLNKFTLLSRLLAFLDIKNWLTARIPDPRVAGVPFKTILADFKGNKGLFYTDNFRLQGPVMEIAANGTVKLGDGDLDMEVGMFPFDTVNWVLNHIPIVGERFGSGTGNLVAAYFDVRGPVSDPKITPKPITSVAEFIKKTLGMPINIIRPNTIK
ncbi:MAG TPA: AsmA-like C-terminal domain-containing protein [Candidatus Binataceae bacterium]|nr:AsmA-like C-terminal domain-containing protein [Candidatus Binataceae bacterium]